MLKVFGHRSPHFHLDTSEEWQHWDSSYLPWQEPAWYCGLDMDQHALTSSHAGAKLPQSVKSEEPQTGHSITDMQNYCCSKETHRSTVVPLRLRTQVSKPRRNSSPKCNFNQPAPHPGMSSFTSRYRISWSILGNLLIEWDVGFKWQAEASKRFEIPEESHWKTHGKQPMKVRKGA